MPAYKDADRGTWYVKFRYTDWQGNRRETTKRGFATKRAAKEFEDEFKRKAQSNPDMTFQSLYDAYLEDLRQHTKESSFLSIDSTIQMHVLPTFGPVPISDITPIMIRKWQNNLNQYLTEQGRPLKPSSIMNINRRLSTILNFGVKYYGLTKNPMHVTGTQGKLEKRIDFWEKDEFDAFLAAEPHALYKAIFELLFYSGMRIGEALALTTDDVDFAMGKYTINKTMTPTGKITPPKTASSFRTITLPPTVNESIRDTFERLEIRSGRIFPTNYANVHYHFRQAIKKSGIRPLQIHCLRHAHASLLIEKGVPITAISKRLGHTSPKVTLSIYSHATSDSDDNIAKLLETL